MSNSSKNDNQHLKDIIIKNRPLLAKNTINTYMASIRKIQQICDCDAHSIEGLIKNAKLIIDSLGEVQTPMVRKSKLSVIIAILDDKHNDHSEELANALKEYRKAMTEDANKVAKRETSQELSEKQKDNLISQAEVMKVYNDLKTEANHLLKKQLLTRTQFETLQKYVLLSMYVLIPPRRSMDYASFKIRNFDESADSSDNYMVNYSKNKKKGNASFVFNTYKNSKRLGRQTVDNIPKPLEKLIDQWKLFNKSDYLLINNQGKPVGQSRIAVLLNEIFGGKNISSSMLRHIYLSDKFKDVNLQELEETAHDMGQKDIRRTLKYVDKNYDEIVSKKEE